MTVPRLNRLFAEDGRCVILAFDHGLFGEPSWMTGIEDIGAVLAEHVAEAPDGMTFPTGTARLLQRLRVARKPSLLLRADVTNGYLGERPERMYGHRLARVVERALALDAVCVIAALLTFPGQPDLHRECFANLDALRAACDPVGMPLMVEVLAMTDNGGVPKVVDDADAIAPLVRQAYELGADVVKADPTAPPEHFSTLVEAAAGIPVLASGGVKAADEQIVHRTADLVAAGASGIAYGRNVIWAGQPAAMTRALIGVVHGGRSAVEAMRDAGMTAAAGAAR